MAQRGRVAVASALAGVACTVAYWAGGAAAWNGDVAAFARAEVLGYAFATSTFDLWVSASPASARMNAPIDQGWRGRSRDAPWRQHRTASSWYAAFR